MLHAFSYLSSHHLSYLFAPSFTPVSALHLFFSASCPPGEAISRRARVLIKGHSRWAFKKMMSLQERRPETFSSIRLHIPWAHRSAEWSGGSRQTASPEPAPAPDAAWGCSARLLGIPAGRAGHLLHIRDNTQRGDITLQLTQWMKRGVDWWTDKQFDGWWTVRGWDGWLR